MLEIFYELKRIKPEAKLLVVGDGILKDEMNSKIKQLNIEESVEMLGSRTDVNHLLQASDVFLLPSKFEGLGIVLIEAQAAGLPTFTSKDVVPEDVSITNLLNFISLKEPSLVWAERIADVHIIERTNRFEQIRKAGFDSTTNIAFLENFYFSIK